MNNDLHSPKKSRTVTKIIFQKRKTDRRSVFLDHEYAFGMSEQTYQQFPLQVSQTLTQKQIAVIQNHEEFEIAKQLALRYLTIRMRSEYELKKYLRKKNCTETAIARTLSYCREQRYCNDEQYAEMLLRDMMNINQYGTNKMRLMLHKRGISSSIINHVLENQVDPDIQLQNALQLAERKIGTIQDSAKIREKLYRFLKQRGFCYQIIRKVLDRLL